MYTNENFNNKIIKTLAKAELEGGGEGVEKQGMHVVGSQWVSFNKNVVA